MKFIDDNVELLFFMHRSSRVCSIKRFLKEKKSINYAGFPNLSVLQQFTHEVLLVESIRLRIGEYLLDGGNIFSNEKDSKVKTKYLSSTVC